MKAFLTLFKNIFSQKNIFHYDIILILASFFLIFGLLFKNISLSLLDPVSDAFSDVQLTDINFSYLGKNDDLRGVDKNGNPKRDTNIVIVNIGNLDRLGIANLIKAVNIGEPKVLGLDAIFEGARDSLSDFTLADALSDNPKTVIAGKGINLNQETKEYENFENPIPLFTFSADLAMANLSIDNSGDNSIEDYKICREFITGHIINDSIYDLAFAPKICSLYNPEKGEKLLARGQLVETINYIGNQFVEFSEQNDDFKYFPTVDFRDIMFMDSSGLHQLFKNKIALLGYLGNTLEDRNDDHDKFYTPLNKKYIGKADQDMFGVVIHANIISMMINERYINKIPAWVSHFIGLFLFYLTIASFRPVYNDHKIWYDGGTKVASFAYAVLILFGSFWAFDVLNYQISISGIYIGAILLAGDYMEIYYGLFVNIFNKITKKG